jgi:CP family cyanate transporter-like MFS transporter
LNKNITTLEDTQEKKIINWMLFIGIIFVGANLRAPLTSVGSLIPLIRDDLGISHAVAGTITTLPLLAFAFLSPFAPKIAKQIGMERTIFLALLLLLTGIIIRSLFGTSFLFVGTIFIGLAIAIGNVLIPGFIKINFPFKVGLVMGCYTVSMNIFGALGSGLSVPLSSIQRIGWKGSLAVWAILVCIALLFWLPQLRKQEALTNRGDTSTKRSGSIWRSPLAWYITLFMGLQSLIFYTLITWLPDILQLYGYRSNAAGWMLFLMQFALIPITFIIPVVAEKMRNQRILGGITAGFFIIGISGILLGNQSLIPIAVIMIGMASGSAFSLCMMFFSLRTSGGQQAAEMSGMAQSFGYLLAAIGPTLFGALHDISGGWGMPLVMLISLAGVIFLVAIAAGKDRIIGE